MVKPNRMRIGTSGWSYPDWQGIVYPRGVRGTKQLLYLARYVDCVEINTSFYRPLNPAYAQKWNDSLADRPDFVFAAKLWQRFTHERSDPWTEREVALVKDGFGLLHEANRLGVVLAQFPWSFRPTQDSVDYLERLAEVFREYPLVVEVRNKSWDCDETWELLQRLQVGFCNIDQPKMRGNIGLTTHVTSDLTYFRLHGRNTREWFREDAGRDARYDYLYNEDELRELARSVLAALEKAEMGFLFTNNHFKGQALVNAIQIRAMLDDEKASVPEQLLEAYPVLKSIVRRAGMLFDEENR